MSSYPSVEVMQMHQMLQAHLNASSKQQQEEKKESQSSVPLQNNYIVIYPNLAELFKEHMGATASSTIDNGLQPIPVKNGIHEVTIHKKANDAAGLWITSMNRGIFIIFVKNGRLRTTTATSR